MAGNPEELKARAAALEAEAFAFYDREQKTFNKAEQMAMRRLGDKSLDLAAAYRQAAGMLR